MENYIPVSSLLFPKSDTEVQTNRLLPLCYKDTHCVTLPFTQKTKIKCPSTKALGGVTQLKLHEAVEQAGMMYVTCPPYVSFKIE